MVKLTVNDGSLSDVHQQMIMVTEPPACNIFSADFTGGAAGLNYVDDAFRNTNQPAYASGQHLPGGGFSGGGLRVLLGGINNDDIDNMSGGWEYSFNLPEAGEVSVSFRYNLIQDMEFESNEYSEALFSFDNTLYGNNGNDYLARIAGNGNGGSDQTTGWQLYQIDLGQISAGNHTLRIGAFNNRKTYNDEITTVLIDDLSIDGTVTPTASFTANIADGPAPGAGYF